MKQSSWKPWLRVFLGQVLPGWKWWLTWRDSFPQGSDTFTRWGNTSFFLHNSNTIFFSQGWSPLLREGLPGPVRGKMCLLQPVHQWEGAAGRRQPPLPPDLRPLHQVWGPLRRRGGDVLARWGRGAGGWQVKEEHNGEGVVGMRAEGDGWQCVGFVCVSPAELSASSSWNTEDGVHFVGFIRTYFRM